jgi:hypothetical protein
MRRPTGGIRSDAPGTLHRWPSHQRITRHWLQTKAIGPPIGKESLRSKPRCPSKNPGISTI